MVSTKSLSGSSRVLHALAPVVQVAGCLGGGKLLHGRRLRPLKFEDLWHQYRLL